MEEKKYHIEAEVVDIDDGVFEAKKGQYENATIKPLPDKGKVVFYRVEPVVPEDLWVVDRVRNSYIERAKKAFRKFFGSRVVPLSEPLPGYDESPMVKARRELEKERKKAQKEENRERQERNERIINEENRVASYVKARYPEGDYDHDGGVDQEDRKVLKERAAEIREERESDS